MILFLVRKFVFPYIVETNLRPDAVLVSQLSKTLVEIEMTVPWEEICEKAHERKGFKYADLMADCKDEGWRVWLFLVDVGCRGFPAQSVLKLLARPGISRRSCKTAVRRLGEAAKRPYCSSVSSRN